MRLLLLYILILHQVTLFGQTISFEFKNYAVNNTDNISLITFDNSNFDKNFTPYLSHNLKGEVSKFSILSLTTEACSKDELKLISQDSIGSSPLVKLSFGVSRGKTQTTVKIFPFVKISGELKKIKKIQLNFEKSRRRTAFSQRSTLSVDNSVLSSGTWYKFKIPNKGIYEFTYEDLISKGIISSPILSNQIGVFSNSAEMLPFIVGDDRMDDLIELPTKLKIEGEEYFGPGNSILFYVGANGKIKYSTEEGVWKNEVNLYSDTNYVFLSIDRDARKKVIQSPKFTPESEIFDYTRIIHHEKEWLSFIKSGRNWYGEAFENGELNFNFSYSKPIQKPKSLRLKYSVCARSETAINNNFLISIDADTISEVNVSKVSSEYYNDYVRFGNKIVDVFYVTNEESYDLKFEYQLSDNPLAWLDKFTINSNERIVSLDSQFVFKILDDSKINTEINLLSKASKCELWDITNLGEVFSIPITKNDSGFTFTSNLDTIRDFILIENESYLKPIYDSKINNQNLHASTPSNYVIITTKDFEDQAKELIKIHKNKDQLSGDFYFVNEIMNEYASGRKEAGAVRNFIKSLYEKGKETNDSLKFVLLLGDGSYDPKDRASNNKNLIPTYQSDNSVKQTRSYVTDDFFGLMDDHEGDYLNDDLLDLGVGRLPVSSVYQTNSVVEKVKNYYNIYPESANLNSYEKQLLTSNGSWKNNILFVADDEDRNIHMYQGRTLSNRVDTIVPNLNHKKIFLDSYEQINTSNGVRVPDANKKMMQELDEGVLIVNFNGHGGEIGWMEERVFMIDDINKMKNKNKLPLFMTATCEFSRFDNPTQLSAGELLALKEGGGAIALFTTVRLVFSAPNFKLNETFYKVLQTSIKDNELALGDIFMKTKVINNGGSNDHNFTLLGDPALRLSIPSYTTLLDSLTLDEEISDTINSLSTPTIYGSILNNDNTLAEDFNGWVEVVLFDKEKDMLTIGSDPDGGQFDFKAQEDLLFKGKAYVINGKFETKIYVPKDARKDFDFARFSFYAVDTIKGESSGSDESIILGGIDEDAINDSRGPQIEIFLDDTTFIFGDHVTSSPIFIAHLVDSSGINIMPNDIGKDINLVIDERNDMNYNLNKFYNPSKTTYRKGDVIFPIDELAEGRHSLEFKAFDNQNNPSKAYTEFIIENNPELALKHVLNYPNPFTTNTGFYFEHNQSSNELDVLVEVFTISGKIIKTLNGTFNTSNQRIGPISWDGLDEYGDRIGRGVYVYKVTVQSSSGDTEHAISKLVLLR